MRAIVTGGLGFIGSHIVDMLIEDGLDVLVIDNLSTGRRQNANARAEYLYDSTARVDKAVYQDADYLFHTAALPRIQPSFEDPILHEEENVVNVLDVLLKIKGSKRLKKLVFCSSSAIYGTPEQLPTTELAPPQPLSPYALQKYSAEQYCTILGTQFDLPVISLRYFNVYGPRSFNPENPYNPYSSVVGIFAEHLKRGKTLTITGDGSQARDFVHVRDVAFANWTAARSNVRRGVYNVGVGSAITILDLAKRFGAPHTFVRERPGEARITWADISRIQSELGWKPKIRLEEGIEELCAA